MLQRRDVRMKAPRYDDDEQEQLRPLGKLMQQAEHALEMAAGRRPGQLG